MKISDSIYYIGVNDHKLDLFEGQYPVPNGMAYNSYVVLDEKVAILDSVEGTFAQQWLDQLRGVLGDRTPDYLVVQHMEPDHSGSIEALVRAFPDVKLVASSRAFSIMENFFGTDFPERQLVVGEGDTLSLGGRTLHFLTAPMVHWPEVIMTYDDRDKVFFSADAFGKFGALDVEEDWTQEARRYYIGIVGKYGQPVQAVLKKAAALDIQTICSLHGPVLQGDLNRYFDLYRTWSSYEPEEEGVVIAYASIYGNTRSAAERLADQLRAEGEVPVVVYDLARCDMFAAVADAFRYSKLVLAASTYNGNVFPFMRTFINHLTERGFRGRTVALIENGSWAPAAARVMRGLLESCKDLRYAKNEVKILSALNEDSAQRLTALGKELCGQEPAGEQEDAPAAKRFVCKICGYIYEGDELPADFVCPLCRRGAEFFEEL